MNETGERERERGNLGIVSPQGGGMDPSQTRRVVLHIDLHPFFTVQDPAQYTAAVLAAGRRLLFFPPLSGSLFAFKPFFSSLSPLLSSSWVHRLFGKSAAFLSFDRPSRIVELLSTMLSSASLDPSACDDDLVKRLSLPRASLIRDSLFQLAYDCMWESPGESMMGNKGFSSVRSNLIVNFSPMPQSKACLSQFLDLSVDDEIMSDMNEIRMKFVQIFGPLNELFISRDVHFTWLHVDLDSQLFVDLPQRNFIERGIRDIGWSLCSTDAVALGAVFIPFGLIYSYIGYQLPSYSVDILMHGQAGLYLEISDVNRKPLECKCCDLDVHFLSLRRETTGILNFFSQDSRGIAQMVVKDVLQVSDQSKIQSQIEAVLLLCGARDLNERVENVREDTLGKNNVFFPEKILELFREDGVAPVVGKPIWQLLLSFLRRRSYCAFVSVNRGNGQSLHGYIMPFTVQSAVMYIVETPNLGSIVPPCSEPAEDKHRRKKRNRFESMIHEVNFDDFRKHVFNENSDANLEVELENFYFVKGRKISKKLRFFRCWMKQFRNLHYSSAEVSGRGVSSDFNEAKGERSVGSEQETAVHVFPLSSTDDTLEEINEEYPSHIFLQSRESFSETVSQKIKRILTSKEADLGLFAERIVRLASHYFSAKLGAGEKEDELNAVVASEVTKVLLERPKDIAAKYKSPNVLNEVTKVREHELQILIRMEILQSAAGKSIEENGKLKFVKDVCLLLENIEFDLQGSMFSGESLIEFAARTIKARYLKFLEPVVQTIYQQMEFVSFDPREEEDSASLPYSNSSEQQRDDKDDVIPTYHDQDGEPNSALTKALERRERARRFSHFTSGRQNLQRVWAPKQAHKNKPAGDPSKKTRRPPSGKDAVCETPLVRHRHHSGTGGSGARISKALFGGQD